MVTRFSTHPHKGVLTNEKHTEENRISYSMLGGVKRLVDGMYMRTVGLYTVVEVIVRGLHIKRKGSCGFAQQSTEPRRYNHVTFRE